MGAAINSVADTLSGVSKQDMPIDRDSFAAMLLGFAGPDRVMPGFMQYHLQLCIFMT